tara:strand:- start:5577 stop:5921 length:345 start_codon:yes stop_codon:yes gene_type:complete
MLVFLMGLSMAAQAKNIEVGILAFENGKKTVVAQVLAEEGKEIEVQDKNRNKLKILTNIVDEDELHIRIRKLNANGKVVSDSNIITFDDTGAEVDIENQSKQMERYEIYPKIMN